jgi:hypothetical protein
MKRTVRFDLCFYDLENHVSTPAQTPASNIDGVSSLLGPCGLGVREGDNLVFEFPQQPLSILVR